MADYIALGVITPDKGATIKGVALYNTQSKELLYLSSIEYKEFIKTLKDEESTVHNIRVDNKTRELLLVHDLKTPLSLIGLSKFSQKTLELWDAFGKKETTLYCFNYIIQNEYETGLKVLTLTGTLGSEGCLELNIDEENYNTPEEKKQWVTAINDISLMLKREAYRSFGKIVYPAEDAKANSEDAEVSVRDVERLEEVKRIKEFMKRQGVECTSMVTKDANRNIAMTIDHVPDTPFKQDIYIPEGVEILKKVDKSCMFGTLHGSGTLREIRPMCFDGIDGAYEVNLRRCHDMKVIGTKAFYNTGINYVYLADETVAIGPAAFADSEVEKINLGKVKVVYDRAFDTSSIREIDISSIKELGDSVFSYCKIKKIKAQKDMADYLKGRGNRPKGISQSAFKDCKIPKPESIKTVGGTDI